MILSGHLGRMFDRVSRKIVCLSVHPNSTWFTVFLVFGILMCAINRLFLNAEKFLLSRDWVVVLSSGKTLSGESKEGSLNATLTALDQLANVISPIVTGVLIFLDFKIKVTL
ncbi:hypothetical protein ANCDUO_17440 [Ancylostoma duodenale]|uniref:Solute carrier family 40 member n=1 Tax=Ancylostoma duodenale TaxID=51022 RepID=A0A0C2G0M8_9BILA|nr:hypothetical protein ANCDUO_17440 [Ancylostoma duodenale]